MSFKSLDSHISSQIRTFIRKVMAGHEITRKMRLYPREKFGQSSKPNDFKNSVSLHITSPIKNRLLTTEHKLDKNSDLC